MSGSKISKALSVFSLYTQLQNHQPKSPEQLVDFVLGQELIAPNQIRSELLEFAKLVAKNPPRTIIEVGSLFGGTLCMFARLAAPDAIIISVDWHDVPGSDRYYVLRKQLFRLFPVNNQKLHILNANSQVPETRKRVEEILAGRPVDILFIDADHSYAGVRADYENFASFVRPGG